MLEKLTPSQTNADYSEIPQDIEYYIKESVMAKQPELTLWEFMDTRPDIDYERWAVKIGSTLTETFEAKAFACLDIDEEDFFDFMRNNKETCQKKYYERRPYHGSGDSELTSNYPMKCGYNARNTIEYNWGLYGDSNEQVKELIGTRDVWENVIGIDYDTALIRLMAYLPGQTLPWHHDNLGNWCRNNKHLNPDVDAQMCDLGPIKRHLVMITDWHWGHVLQIENSYFPNWKSGEVYNLPIPRPHCSTNMGMRLKLTCSISGAQINENLSY
jgi:hypothetical protein|tara:strand:+ start:1287 stop:2099 length:813 start_codon:yes stop_codon:yes gene_type:complete